MDEKHLTEIKSETLPAKTKKPAKTVNEFLVDGVHKVAFPLGSYYNDARVRDDPDNRRIKLSLKELYWHPVGMFWSTSCAVSSILLTGGGSISGVGVAAGCAIGWAAGPLVVWNGLAGVMGTYHNAKYICRKVSPKTEFIGKALRKAGNTSMDRFNPRTWGRGPKP
ncbi:MAG: hypothetical protein PHE27_05380 [Alphaproteobacteria bacterium]|nr:hypothetical protein [Alphaproteobacteria bacterium]